MTLFGLRGEHDLAFADDRRLLEQMLEAVRSGPNEALPAGAVSELLLALPADGDDGIEGLEGYHRMADDRIALLGATSDVGAVRGRAHRFGHLGMRRTGGSSPRSSS